MLEKSIDCPAGVEVKISNGIFNAKGVKGSASLNINSNVLLKVEDSVLKLTASKERFSRIMLGTTCALVKNIIIGVTQGYEKKLELKGVGYRAQLKGKKLNLVLGYSHPIEYSLPKGIELELPSQTEIIVKGIDKQQIGQVAAEIRAFRKVEPYKGKGIRYSDEKVVRKEAKKK